MKKTSLAIRAALALMLPLLMLASCSTPQDVAYMQDLQGGAEETVEYPSSIKIQPGDKISIVVKSKNPELADLFNLTTFSYRVGAGKSSSLSQELQAYLVDGDGNIDFPVLGTIHVGGLSRDEIAKTVKDKLIASSMVKDPVVTVDFDNLSFAVLGEVKDPGQFAIDRDKMTIFDAIAKAGDLTIYGNRKDVKVQRRIGDKVKVYSVDLTSGESPIKSPVYYLQQNDVVYVTPNETRQRQSTVNGNNVRSTSFWISLTSLAATIAAVIIAATN